MAEKNVRIVSSIASLKSSRFSRSSEEVADDGPWGLICSWAVFSELLELPEGSTRPLTPCFTEGSDGVLDGARPVSSGEGVVELDFTGEMLGSCGIGCPVGDWGRIGEWSAEDTEVFEFELILSDEYGDDGGCIFKLSAELAETVLCFDDLAGE